MNLEKKDLIEKWKVTCALRGVSVFNDTEHDSEFYDVLSIMQDLENSRNERNVIQLCADELFRLGLNYHDFMDYDSLMEQEREAARDLVIAEILKNNELVQETLTVFNLTKVTGPNKNQKYYEMSVPTKRHSLVNVKIRIVTISWNRIRVWTDYEIPNEPKVHEFYETTWHMQHQRMNKGFPKHWRENSAHNCGTNNIELTIAWNIAKGIESKYKKSLSRKKVKNV